MHAQARALVARLHRDNQRLAQLVAVQRAQLDAQQAFILERTSAGTGGAAAGHVPPGGGTHATPSAPPMRWLGARLQRTCAACAACRSPGLGSLARSFLEGGSAGAAGSGPAAGPAAPAAAQQMGAPKAPGPAPPGPSAAAGNTPRAAFGECGVCLDAPCDTALGCGHLACARCGALCAECPFCRAPVLQRIWLWPSWRAGASGPTSRG